MTKETKFKVGDKVRVVAASCGWAGVSKGDEGVIAKINKDGSYEADVPSFSSTLTWTGEEYCFELVSPKPTKKQRLTMLEQKVEALQAEIDALKAAQKPPVTTITDAIRRYKERTPNEQASANEKRKAIIDEAKAFVESKFSDGNDGVGKVVWGDAGHNKVEFVVNAEKRTVVAILRLAYVGHIVTSKGIAKCAPTDVFNADIGKAIALGRALGLDVSKFEKAVQPSEVVVGMNVVKTEGVFAKTSGNVYSVGDKSYLQGENGLCYKRGSGDSVWAFKDDVKVIDDTEAQY